MGPSTRIGRYWILRRIRSGGEGSVYLGYDPQLQRRVAVKLSLLPLDPVRRRRVLREARLVASLQSRQIVGVFDVISAKGHLAIVMEYIPGCDLEELLQAGPLTLNAILGLAIDLGSALATSRAGNVVHGDLKASNVLIHSSGRALLADFGIARQGEAGNEILGVTGGSRSSLSPEHLLGKPLDLRSDLFALGCLLYRMISGRHPFLENGELRARRLLEEEPAPLPESLADGTPVPAGLRKLIFMLMRKTPEERSLSIHRVRQQLREEWRSHPQLARQMPLAGVRSRERGESEDELPPSIPRSLSGSGRSELAPWRVLRDKGLPGFLALLRGRRVQALLAASFIALGSLFSLLQPHPQRVQLAVPTMRASPGLRLPLGLQAQWLQERFCGGALAVNERLLFYSDAPACPSGLQGYPDNRDPPPADEAASIELRCESAACIVWYRRRHEGGMDYRRALFLPSSPLEEWSRVLEDMATDLYRHPRSLPQVSVAAEPTHEWALNESQGPGDHQLRNEVQRAAPQAVDTLGFDKLLSRHR